MTIFDVSFTASDVLQTNWEQALSECEKRDCSTYSRCLLSRAGAARASGNEVDEAIFVVLGYVFSINLKLDEKNNPFISPQGGGSALGVLRPMHFQIFKDLLDSISDAEARARLKDILWVEKKIDYQIALTAIDDYLVSANVLEHPVEWPLFVDRLERAMQLAASLRNEQALRKVREHIIAVLEKYDGDDPLFMSERLMLFLQRFSESRSEPIVTKYTALAEKIALRNERQNDWRTAREYWRVKAQWHALVEDGENRRAALIKAAETHVNEAESRVRVAPQGYSFAGRMLTEAIEEFRRIAADETLPYREDVQLRITQLRQILAKYQREALREMELFSQSMDISELVTQAQEKVKGRSLIDALLILAGGISGPVKKSDLRKLVEETMKNSIYMMFRSHTLDEFGRIIAVRPGIVRDTDNEKEATLRAEMFRMANLYQDLHGLVINAAIYQINAEHSIGLHDLFPFVTSHPFIPPGRENIYAQGFYSGLTGDMLQAMHLLIPQLENSIRYILRSGDTIVSGLDSVSGIEEDYDLNRLLYIPKLENILGEDIVFNLRGLLVERFGSNVRNSMAHGQIDYGSFFSSRMVYIWWLILFICALPIINSQAVPAPNESDVDNKDSEPAR